MVDHQRLELAGHLFLGPAGPKPATLDEIGQCGVGRLAGQPQQRDLAGVLDLAQRLHGAGRANQLDPGRLSQRAAERVESVDGHHMTFETDPADPTGCGTPGKMRPACSLDA